MKVFRKFLLPVLLGWFVLSATARAEYVDDLKMEVARLLPTGTHRDKVRQFLKVRKFKVTEPRKEKTLTGTLPTKRMLVTVSVLTVVFDFDDDDLVKDVHYTVTKIEY